MATRRGFVLRADGRDIFISATVRQLESLSDGERVRIRAKVSASAASARTRSSDTTNNITHAVLAGLGLIVGMLPRDTQRPSEERAGERRFGPEQREPVRGETIGRDAR